jgi:N-acetylglucosaminyldiphosphoundecaprenol N-acetyl-beta-D-mannosaminyltransferase
LVDAREFCIEKGKLGGIMKITVGGVAFDNLTLSEAVREAMRGNGEACRVYTPNALMLRACTENPKYTELLNSASLVLPDGAGVLLAARRQGTPLRERVAGISFGEALLCEAARGDDRVFLLGGKEGVAPRAAENLQKRYPGLNICGAYWGYFEKEGEENRRVLGMIKACRPDILLVCFGFPVQEVWIRENLPYLPSVRIAAGLGGSLDVWAGDVRRAPVFVQRRGLEWAWRMAAEPKRLAQLPQIFRFAQDFGRETRKGRVR